jgi:hypothetical protein
MLQCIVTTSADHDGRTCLYVQFLSLFAWTVTR